MLIFFAKFAGSGGSPPPAPPVRVVLLAALGAAGTTGLLALSADATRLPFVIGSFGASCFLVYGFPEADFAQPRSIVGGHFVSSLLGVATVQLFGAHWWSVALALALATAAILLLRVAHPPASSNPVIAFLGQPDWSFVIFPSLAGALLLVLCALIFNNATRPMRYPKYW